VILHGDVAHQNVLGFGDKGWLAVDPKGLIGDRAYDYANIFRNPTTALTTPTRLRRQADVMAEGSGLESRTLLQWGFVHAALSVAWWLEDGHALTEGALRIPNMCQAVLEAGSGPDRLAGGLVDHATLHHEGNPFELCDIGKRVAGYGNDVGIPTGLHRADIGGMSQEV